MRNKIFYFVLVIFCLTIGLANVYTNTASSSNGTLKGPMDLQFNLNAIGATTPTPGWMGTVTLNGHVYGMVFYNIGTGKPFTTQNPGNMHFFGEHWIIYDSISITWSQTNQGHVIDWGHGSQIIDGYDHGEVSGGNDAYRMNSQVATASGSLQAYLGHNVHMGGYIYRYSNGLPYQAPGVFQIDG